jgi:hypothetical protein
VETRTPETLEDFVTMADTYRVHAIGKESGHELSAELFERKNRWLGVPATVISAVVGSSIFASLASEKTSIVLMVVTGSLSICAAVLSALQTFLRYSETAQTIRRQPEAMELFVARSIYLCCPLIAVNSQSVMPARNFERLSLHSGIWKKKAY